VLTVNTDLAELKKHVAGMPGGLDAKVYEGGKSTLTMPVLSVDTQQ